MRIATLSFAGLVTMIAISGTVGAARAAREVLLRAGAPDGANATFRFDKDIKPRAITLNTTAVGVAGSRLEITVDQTRIPVFSHIFTPAECNFATGGSRCEILISANDPAYRRIIAGFKRGRVARVTVADAGVMKMDETLSLIGFAKALR